MQPALTRERASRVHPIVRASDDKQRGFIEGIFRFANFINLSQMHVKRAEHREPKWPKKISATYHRNSEKKLNEII